jgi:hypothetical protein
MGMRSFRVALPVSFGCFSMVLMLWAIHAERACVWCDTGSPVWPYQAPFLLLSSINAPAIVLVAPFFLLPHLESDIARYPAVLAMIVLWWWWVGTRFDFGLLDRREYPRPKQWATLFSLIGIVLLYVAERTVAYQVHWRSTYGHPHPFVLATTVLLVLWALVLAGACFLAAVRLARRRLPVAVEHRSGLRVLAFGYGCVALVAATASLIGYTREPRVDPDSCVSSRDTGCLHGTVADHAGRPLK